jgi:HEPN domain-containing protein
MIVGLLTAEFEEKYVKAAVKHFEDAVEEFQKNKWDDASAKGGKCIEAVLKALWKYAGETVPAGKDFKAGKVIDQIATKASVPDTIRLTIPRACRFAYEIASNRGARHDADEIDANEMDARTVVSVCAWILSEMVRFSQRGRDLAAAADIVEGLTKRRYPFAEEIEGRHYADIGTSALEKALVILYSIYPKRLARADLIETLVRHPFKRNNANVAIARLAPFIDDDGNGNIRLRNSGLQRFDQLFGTPKN